MTMIGCGAAISTRSITRSRTASVIRSTLKPASADAGLCGYASSRLKSAVVQHVQIAVRQAQAHACSARWCCSVRGQLRPCHGPDGKGVRAFGAPNLTDGIWLYGGDSSSLYRQTITLQPPGRHAALGRQSSIRLTIKMLAAYVHSLGGGEATVAAAPIAATPAAAARRRNGPWPMKKRSLGALREAQGRISQGSTDFSGASNGNHGRDADHLLCHAMDALGSGPYAPDQAVLIDLANRRFYMFADRNLAA
jgi:hypothetical protein